MFTVEPIPNRPWKSFDWYLIARRSKSYGQKLLFPCPSCCGSYRLVAPGSFCDPNEGYRNAERVNCPHCIKGETTMDKLKVHYNEEIEKWKKRKMKAKELRKVQISGLRKLTKAEKKALRLI